MKSNKKWLQFIAAMWILTFHLWINVSGSVAEAFFVKIGYVGVDIFFFVSAYSLAQKQIKYKEFVRNRFIDIYGKFLLFSLLAAVVKHWSLERFIMTICFVDLFQNGGGAFLWFVPAILLFYLIYPLFVNWKHENKVIFVFGGWLVFSLTCQEVFDYTKIFIFTNRIPVLLSGYLLAKHKIPKPVGWLCLPVGLVIAYLTGFRGKLQVPIHEMYFVCGIVPVIGIVQLCSVIKTNKFVDIIAGASLEIYALQMIYGPKLVTDVFLKTQNKILTNIIVFTVIIVLSILVHQVFLTVKKRILTWIRY